MDYAVQQWSPLVAEIRQEMGSGVTDAEVLAMIELESSGNIKARRPKSQYFGLLQIGASATAEAIRIGGEPFAATGPAIHARNPAMSIRTYHLFMRYYENRHGNDLRLKALLWKGGPFTVKLFRERLEQGESHARRWLQSFKRIGNGLDYLDRAMRMTQEWMIWVNDQNAPYLVCSANLMNPHALVSTAIDCSL